jgi:hypothetical protein
MFNSQLPSISDLPTSRQLIGSTLVAIAGAAVILVTVVLPSEYGIDPTGAGRAFGLTEMGEIKVQLAQEAASDRVSEPSEASDNAVSSGVPTVDRGTTPAKADAQSPNTAVRSDQTEVVLNRGRVPKSRSLLPKALALNSTGRCAVASSIMIPMPMRLA